MMQKNFVLDIDAIKSRPYTWNMLSSSVAFSFKVVIVNKYKLKIKYIGELKSKYISELKNKYISELKTNILVS